MKGRAPLPRPPCCGSMENGFKNLQAKSNWINSAEKLEEVKSSGPTPCSGGPSVPKPQWLGEGHCPAVPVLLPAPSILAEVLVTHCRPSQDGHQRVTRRKGPPGNGHGSWASALQGCSGKRKRFFHPKHCSRAVMGFARLQHEASLCIRRICRYLIHQ